MFLICYQVWAYTGNDEVRCDDICLDVASRGANVMMIKCHHQKGNQVWNYDEQVKATRLWCHTIILLHLVSWLLFFNRPSNCGTWTPTSAWRNRLVTNPSWSRATRTTCRNAGCSKTLPWKLRAPSSLLVSKMSFVANTVPTFISMFKVI